MPSNTPNRDYNRPDAGTSNWNSPLNDNFTDLDTDIQDLFDNKADVSNAVTGEVVDFSTGHAQWADGLSNAEIYRISLQSSETFELSRVEARLNGGGTASNLTVEVYDVAAGAVIDSTTGGSVSVSGSTSNEAATVIVRISNSTGNLQEANIVVRGVIN